MLKRFFIPHKHNEYKPHIFRTAGLTLILVVIAGIAGLRAFQTTIIEQTDYLASVVTGTLVDLTNADRSQNAVGTLAVSPLLQAAAQKKADDMAAKGYFAHNSPEGITPWHWFAEAGYDYMYAGENLAVNFDDSIEVEEAWMNSPLHRANIVNSNFTEIGIATAQGMYQGKPTTFVVQLFGTPIARTQTAAALAPVATGSPAPAAEPEQTTIISSDTFIAVSRTDTVPNTVLGESAAQTDTAKSGASVIGTLVTSPNRTSQIILILLAVVILMSLVLIIGIEASRKDAKHMIMGILVFVLILALIFHFKSNILGGVVVV